MVWVHGDHEVLVGSVSVHASPRIEASPRQVRDVPGEVAADEVDLLFTNLPVYRLRGGGDAVGPEEGGLHAAVVVLGREAVEQVAVVGLPDKDWEALREEKLRTARWLEPVHHLPRHLKGQIHVREQLRGPGAR